MPLLPRCVYRSVETRKSFSNAADARGKGMNEPFDLCSPDGYVISIERVNRTSASAVVKVTSIPSTFVGFGDGLPQEFILKSSLTQLGLNAKDATIKLSSVEQEATVNVTLVAYSPLGILTLDYVGVNSYIGKLFCPDPSRIIKSMDYIDRLLDKRDMHGDPLLVYGGGGADEDWDIKLVNGRVIAYLPVQPGVFRYSGEIHGLLPTVGKALKENKNYKELLRLHQEFNEGHTRVAVPNEFLMVRSYDMRLRTMFGRVVNELLPTGLRCMSSTVIEPGSKDQSLHGRTFVFEGESTEELTAIPVEFFRVESYREHVTFEERTSLPERATNPADIAKIYRSMPKDCSRACTYVCSGKAFNNIKESDWVVSDPHREPYVGTEDPALQAELASRYLFQHGEYGILSALSVGVITSDGILVCKYFPSPILKSLLLSRQVCKHVRAIYFVKASKQHGSFFSQDDRSMLADLNTFGISVYQYDEATNEIFQFMRRKGSDHGLFIPMNRREEYLSAVFFGVYGSNLVAGNFEAELMHLMNGLLEIQKTSTHPKFNPKTPIALVTGGGPGAMEVGNRVAKTLGILSCGLFVDFGSMANKPGATINEQKKNPYVEAFMTYRPEKLVERQSDFNLDFPIFLTGGIGTDFEYALEEVRRKVGTVPANPMVLFGTAEHWGNKISSRFNENRVSGTIKGSEWLSTVPYVVANGKQALAVYTKFFNGTLACGAGNAANDKGFVLVDDSF